MVRSTVNLVLTQENAPLSAICALLELRSFIADLSQKLVPPPSPWLRHDTSMLISPPHGPIKSRDLHSTESSFPNTEGIMGTFSFS